MSVHFTAECPYLSKKGKPGSRESIKSNQIISNSELEHIVNTLLTEVKEMPESRLEIDRKYSKVLQI